jgi:hypothetical protein
MISAIEPCHCSFQFERDTFAYPNELVWEYEFEPKTGAMISRRNDPPRTYTHRCFVMVRSVRQFSYHARFDPAQPVAGAPVYRRLVRDIVTRNPRRASADEDRVVVPGYDSLRSFSLGQESVLKAVCGGAWQSYVLRSHWRMILPVWGGHQERMANQLAQSLAQGCAPIVHLFRFPQLTINHGVVLYALERTESGLRFTAYDPNIAAHPTELNYSSVDRRFYFPRNHYWAGGRVHVVEVYRGWLY